jgi:hypothetical protein
MDIQSLTAFFMWCTIIHAGLLLVAFVISVLARDLVFRIHSRWFPMSRETFGIIFYAFLGVYKTLFFVFGVIPYVALLIIG